MTDEQMDARLRAAGERWRTENATVAVVEPSADVAPHPADITTTGARRRRWGLIGSAAAVAAALVVGGTFLLRDAHNAPAPPGDTAALEGHVWVLQGVQGTQSTATLYVDRDGNLVADDECQLIGGHVALDGNTMTVTDQVRRYKSCTDQYGTGFYQDGAAVLDGTATLAITSEGLTIRNSGKELKFTLAPANTPVPTMAYPTLVGTDWILASADGYFGNVADPAGDPKLHIDDNGKLVGTDGCNTIEGTVTMDGNRMIFGTLGGTERACTGTSATVTAVHAVLHGTATETVAGGELTIGNGAAELIYEWAPTSATTDPNQLYGTTWSLTNNAGTAVPVGAQLQVCSQLSQGCIGCQWQVSAGTMRLEPVQASACTKMTPLQKLFGQNVPVVWSVYNGQLFLYLNDTQGSALVFDKYSPTQPPPTNAQLVGPTWHLVSIKAGDGRYRNGAPPAEESTLTFTDTGFTERHVCYTQLGDVAIDRAAITITNTHSTGGLPCPFTPGRDAAAQLVDSILADGVTWSIDGDKLTIQHDTVGWLTFSTSTTSVQNDPLTGTNWQLETAVDNDGNEHPADGLSFAIKDDKLLADDGLNTINASLQISDGIITLADVASSAVGSTQDDPVRRVVDDVLQDGDVGYQISGDVLTLSLAAEQLIYRASADTGSQSIVGTWNLTTIEHGTGTDASASQPSVSVQFTFGASGHALYSNCDRSTMKASGAKVVFGEWFDDLTVCAPLTRDQESFVITRVLTNTCSYAIDGDQLTITKDGVGAIVLTRA